MSGVNLLLNAYRRPESRHPPGHPRPDGAPHVANDGSAARLRTRQAHPADRRGRALAQSGDALPGAPAPGAARLDSVVMGRLRGQPPREILRAHARRASPDRARVRRLDPHRRDHAALHGVAGMTSLRRMWASLWGRGLDRELDDEIAEHLALQEDEFRRAGMSSAAARDAALREFGGVART